MSEHFEYFNSPETTFNVLGDVREAAIYDAKHNTITFHDIFEVENKTGHTVDDVVVVLPYVWAVVPPPPKGTESPIGDPGFVALDFEDGAWTAENFNDVEGLDLKVTAEIVPLDQPYTTGSIAAGSIASNAGLTDDFGPSSADYPLKASLPPETLDGDDLIPSVNLGELEPHEEVTLDLVFTYQWTLDGKKADYDALFTPGAVFTLDSVPTAGAVDDLWL